VKAVFINQFGGPEVLQYGDMPDPVAGPGQVVIDVVAASINGADWRVRAGLYSEGKFPLILGRDFSGTVAALGAGVEDLKVSDAVFGVLEAGREGAYAEKLAITAAIVAKKPATLSHIDAAATLALTGLTALISRLGARGYEGGAAAGPQHGETLLRHVAADGIERCVAAADHLREVLRPVVDDLIGAEAAHIVDIRRAGRGDHPRADMLGDLDGDAGDTAGAALNEDRFAALKFEGGLDRDQCSEAG
jgi:hypothetical protein